MKNYVMGDKRSGINVHGIVRKHQVSAGLNPLVLTNALNLSVVYSWSRR